MRALARINRIIGRVLIEDFALARFARSFLHSILAAMAAASFLRSRRGTVCAGIKINPVAHTRIRGGKISHPSHLVIDHLKRGLGFKGAAAHVGLGRRDELDIAAGVFRGEKAEQPVLIEGSGLARRSLGDV